MQYETELNKYIWLAKMGASYRTVLRESKLLVASTLIDCLKSYFQAAVSV